DEVSRKLTSTVCARRSVCQVVEVAAMAKASTGGAAETEITEVAVNPIGASGPANVITATPAGCCRKSCLNSVLSRPSAPSADDVARRRARSVSLTVLTSSTVTRRAGRLFLRLVVSPGEHGGGRGGSAPSGWLTRHASALYCAHVGLERQPSGPGRLTGNPPDAVG